MTELYLLDIREETIGSFLKQAAGSLSPYRQEKAEAFRFEKDRLLSVAASLLLDLALRPYGKREKDMTYLEEPGGKPMFPENDPFYFSISHSGSMAALAVSQVPVGCDIQQRGKSDRRITVRWFTPEEARFVAEGDDAGSDRRFTDCWAKKESFGKVTGRGLSSFSEFSVVDEAGKEQCPQVDGTPYRFQMAERDGYSCAVCLPAVEELRQTPVNRSSFF